MKKLPFEPAAQRILAIVAKGPQPKHQITRKMSGKTSTGEHKYPLKMREQALNWLVKNRKLLVETVGGKGVGRVGRPVTIYKTAMAGA